MVCFPHDTVELVSDLFRRKRLLDMGVLAGEVIRVEGVAPLGDPMEVLVRNYRLTLRKHEVEGILVEEVR